MDAGLGVQDRPGAVTRVDGTWHMPTLRVSASSWCINWKDLLFDFRRPGDTACQFRGRESPSWIRTTMERGASGSRRENMGKNVTRSRDAAQVREHLLCKQPALHAVVYSVGFPLKTPQLSAVMNPFPRVQCHHQSRCLNGLHDTSPAP